MATDPLGGRGPILPNDSLPRTTTEGQKSERSQRLRTDQNASRPDAPASNETAHGEKVQISREARELLEQNELMRNARRSLDESPDVRADRVREVKRRLDAGVYDTKGVRDELAHRLSSILSSIELDGQDD